VAKVTAFDATHADTRVRSPAMNYREAPAPRPHTISVVRYRPSSGLGLAQLVFAMMIGVVGLLAIAAMPLRRVVIRCERATNACRIETHWPIGLTTATVLPLDHIDGTVMMGDKKNGDDVAFTTVDDARQATNVTCPHGTTDSLEVRTAQKARIDAFLADPNAPSLEVDYSSSSWGGASIPLALLVLPIWGLVAIANDARFEIDWDDRRAHIIRTRRPFSATHVRMDLDAIVDAKLLEVPNRKGPGSSWNVEIVTKEHRKERLAQAAGTSKERAEKVIAEIRKLLKKRDQDRT
jgi:hypothetical protein